MCVGGQTLISKGTIQIHRAKPAFFSPRSMYLHSVPVGTLGTRHTRHQTPRDRFLRSTSSLHRSSRLSNPIQPTVTRIVRSWVTSHRASSYSVGMAHGSTRSDSLNWSTPQRPTVWAVSSATGASREAIRGASEQGTKYQLRGSRERLLENNGARVFYISGLR